MAGKIVNGNEKLKLMIDLLKEAGDKALTTSDLMQLLDCNRNSVNNYYKRSIESGIKIIKTNIGHETAYYLEDNDQVYEPMTSDMVRKFMIMQRVKPGRKRKQEVLGFNYNDRERAYEYLGSIGTLGVTKYYELINELIDEGELVCIGERYYPGRRNIPVIWFVNEVEAMDYLNILAMMPPGFHSQSIVESVFNKINAVYESEERDDDAYVVLGRSYELLNRIHELMSVLNKADYINRLVKISYLGKNNKSSENVIAVGLVVYSAEKDKLYVIGERRGTGTDVKRPNDKKDLTVFFDAEKIRDVNAEKGINRSYHSRRFIDMYNRMFSIGNSELTEKEEEISLMFDDEEYIRERLENLCEYREASGAYLEYKNKKIIYHDNIIGIDDLFRFLRQFIGKYEICNSDILTQKKKESLEKTLRRYTEGMADE